MTDKDEHDEENIENTDEMEGDVEKQKPLTREGFLDMLSKISRPLAKPSDKEKSETTTCRQGILAYIIYTDIRISSIAFLKLSAEEFHPPNSYPILS